MEFGIWVILLLGLFCLLAGFFWNPYGKKFRAEDFGIKTVKSSKDADQDGIDDYTDLLYGAKAEAERKPTYKSAYYSGGYPPETEGVCTDVIWRAFRNAGYNLKELVDQDIQKNVQDYARVNGKPDPNIDFRRVPNLKVYFEKYAQNLTTDLKEIEEWQLGDIVIFETSHIGILSDFRNRKGIPYLIHNAGQPNREEDVLEIWNQFHPISGHYRMQ